MSRIKQMIRKTIAVMALAAILGCAGIPAVPVQAAAPGQEVIPYGFYAAEGGVMWSNGDGTFKRDDWLHHMDRNWYFGHEGYLLTGFHTISGILFYLPADGMFRVGWNTVSEGKYYLQQDGSVAVNTVIDGERIGADGLVITGRAAQAASSQAAAPTQPVSEFHRVCLEILSQITTPEMTNEQKLQAAYQWVLAVTTYKRTYETPSGDWTKAYAMDIYSTGQGNCYRYAAAFAYLAKALGYEVRVCTGQISARRGGTTPHGWVEVNYGGQWLICDPDMQDTTGGNYYLKTFQAYPVKPLNKAADWPIAF